MQELMGSLIQMNAHMVVTNDAHVMIWVGAVFVVLLLIASFWAFKGLGWKWSVIFGTLAVVSAVVFVIGLKRPRVKEIKACANGPVSLEQVATAYQIIEIDGKMLTLRER